MEELVIQTKNPNLQLKFNINNTYKPESYDNSNFAEFITKIPDDWHFMKVGKGKDNYWNMKVRSAKSNRNISIFPKNINKYYDEEYYGYNNEDFRDTIREINNKPNNKLDKETTVFINDCTMIKVDNNLIAFNKNSIQNGIGNFKLIRYNLGDHFNEFHYDTLHTSNDGQMIGTALLFPPAHISPFTGGDLIFKINEEDQELTYTIEPSKFTDWTLITFGHLLHKCTPIITGTRYVIKGEIWSCFPNLIQYPLTTDIKLLLETTIHTIPQRITELRKTITDKVTNLFQTQLTEEINDINSNA
jgi:hypothetical protein